MRNKILGGVDSDDREVAVFELKQVGTSVAGWGFLSVGVRVGANAS